MSLLEKEPVKRVEKYLREFDANLNIISLDKSARTAIEAASSLKCEVGAIVKSLLFKTENSFTLFLVAGDKEASLNKIKDHSQNDPRSQYFQTLREKDPTISHLHSSLDSRRNPLEAVPQSPSTPAANTRGGGGGGGRIFMNQGFEDNDGISAFLHQRLLIGLSFVPETRGQWPCRPAAIRVMKCYQKGLIICVLFIKCWLEA